MELDNRLLYITETVPDDLPFPVRAYADRGSPFGGLQLVPADLLAAAPGGCDHAVHGGLLEHEPSALTCPPESQNLLWIYTILARLVGYIVGGALADRAGRRGPAE